MLNNLFRKYNQNKRGLWTIIIVIVFSYIVLQAIYGLLRNNKEKRKEELINQIINIKIISEHMWYLKGQII